MDVLLEKTQAMQFASVALPELFHTSPEQFITYLTRDGNRFLRFYWEQAAKIIREMPGASSFGLNYEIRRPFKKRDTVVVLVTLPKPKVQGETYYLGLVYRPHRVTPFLRISDTTSVLALELDQPLSGEPSTLLVEWTRRLVRDKIGQGPAPDLAEFFKVVIERVRD